MSSSSFRSGAADAGNNVERRRAATIAFWTHTIDLYARRFREHKSAVLPPRLRSPKIHNQTDDDDDDEYSWVGAIRSGFRHAVSDGLPEDDDEVRVAIEAHLTRTVRALYETTANKDLLECDVVFGTHDPTNFYYSGVRLRHRVPLTTQEENVLEAVGAAEAIRGQVLPSPIDLQK